MQFGKQYREVKLRYVYLFLHSFEETCLYGRLYFKVRIVVTQEIKIHYKRCNVNKNCKLFHVILYG